MNMAVKLTCIQGHLVDQTKRSICPNVFSDYNVYISATTPDKSPSYSDRWAKELSHGQSGCSMLPLHHCHPSQLYPLKAPSRL